MLLQREGRGHLGDEEGSTLAVRCLGDVGAVAPHQLGASHGLLLPDLPQAGLGRGRP